MKKKILSLALACLMIMTAFATAVPAFAEETVCTVKIGDAESVACTSYAEAIGKIDYTQNVVIDVIADLTLTSALTEKENHNGTSVSITINGNGHTLTASATPFLYNWNDAVTVNDLIIKVSGGTQIAQYGRNTVLTFNNCDFYIDDCAQNSYKTGLFGAANGTNDNNILNITGTSDDPSKIRFTKTEGANCANGYIFGSNGKRYTLNLECVDIDAANGEDIRIAAYAYNSVNEYPKIVIDNSTITANGDYVFNDINRGQLYLNGKTTITNKNSNGCIIKVNVANASNSNAFNMYVEKDVKLISEKFVETLGMKFYCYADSENFYSTYSDSATPVYTAPEMITGASIKIDPEYSGLRFSAIFDNSAACYDIIVFRKSQYVKENRLF